jgi:lipooligosaccharide transport system ATP-binding protein
MSLDGREQAPIRELSGGLKRRLVMARALLNDPEMVVLDEPTTGLDPQVRHLIWARLRELKARGVTLLLTTHYMEEAHQLCDRLLVMDGGRILAEGRPRELVASRLPGHVLELPSDVAAAILPAGTEREVHGDLAFVYSASPEELERLAATTSVDYRIRSTTLEDLFLKLTGRDLRESD